MSWLAKRVAMVLLALWAPVTVHCQLEAVAGLEFLACCHHAGAAPHQDNDCEQDACAVVESGHYLVPGSQPEVPAPALWAAASLYWPPPAEVTPPHAPRADLVTAPPQLLASWRFALRAAPPVRAPSFAS